MDAEKPEKPSVVELISNQRRESIATLGDLAVKEKRLAKSLEDVRVKIAQVHDDIMALDKMAGLVG